MRRPRTLSIALSSVAVLLAGGLLSAAAHAGTDGDQVAAAQAAANAPTPVTPILVAPIGDPLVVPGSDGRLHVDYDLLVTNAFTAPVTLTAVNVRDQSGGPLLNLTGDALAAVTEGNFYQSAVQPPAVIPVSAQVTVGIDVVLRPGAVAPRQVSHVIRWSLPPDSKALALLDGKSAGQVNGVTLTVSRTRPVVIAAPLPGDGWWSLQGCCTPNGHRSLRVPIGAAREVKSEMFAADWVRLQDGAFFSGDGSSNADYHYIGTNELAVADGTVVATRDGLPNELPGPTTQYVKKARDYIGNSVVLQIAPDRYAIYGHMLAGSLRVRPGDHVTAGQVVGKLGNSGNTTAAHLHFVITDSPDFLSGTSIPFVIARWNLQGTAVVPDEPGPITLAPPSGPQVRTHPLVGSVSDFG